MTLFECKVRYHKIDESSGKDKKLTETYLFDAVSYTEAEQRVYKEMAEIISGDFAVTGIRKASYAEIFPSDDGDRWYRCKVSFGSIDEEAGKEKKVSNQILVLAANVRDCYDKIEQQMGQTIDIEVNSIAESPVVDFFPYFDKDAAPEDRELSRRPATPEELEAAAQNRE